jgi:mycothiol synthase
MVGGQDCQVRREEGYTMIDIRTFRHEDIPALAALINEADAVDQMGRATTAEELEHRLSFPSSHPETDCFVACEGGRAEGYVSLYLARGKAPSGSVIQCQGAVHPQSRRRGVGRQLLEVAESRSHEMLVLAEEGPVHLQCMAGDGELGRLALFEGFGLAPVRYYVNLSRPIDNGLPPLVALDGVRLRTFHGTSDLEAVRRVEMEAFRDDWSHTEANLEDYAHWVTLDYFHPELWFLAEEEATGKVVGLGLNMINPGWIAQTGRQEGYVDTLAVLREYRKRGLGTALLVRCLHALRHAGMDSAHLHADAENPAGAMRLYERAGFRVRQTHIAYRSRLR